MGHVFTGLEAMICPKDKVEVHYKKYGLKGMEPVEVANEEFATWVGDLGSALARKIADELERNQKKPWDSYFLQKKIKKYPVDTLASESDLLGDIDAYAIRHGLTGVDCEKTRMLPIKNFDKKVSEIIAEYYTGKDGPLAGLIRRRFSCFCKAIGISVGLNNEINTRGVVSDISPRIIRFAKIWYRKEEGVFTESHGIPMQMAVAELSELFVEWLAKGLQSERG